MNKLISLTLCIFALSGCATMATSNKLSEFKKVDWEKSNRRGIEKILGQPNSVGSIPKTDHEGLVYLSQDKKTPQLLVIYDGKTDKVLSVHWFAANPSEQLTLQQAFSQFPNIKFQEKPIVKEGAWGQEISAYTAKESPLSINMNSQTQKLSSISLQFAKEEPITRKPTSH
ncbi:hypothetical protein [Bdellovibrio sp. HCB-162]|uniref:hypothetical protein n=1 Tax=Bdellovibrio sp. HCB-162 TaxID=3394234 RepID=UPI0039BC5F3D